MQRRNFLAAAASFLQPSPTTSWEWREYGADPSVTRFAPLNQVNTSNVEHLETAWTLETLPAGVRPQGTLECTPIVVDGILYLSAHGLHTHALEAHTGKLLWSNDGFDGGRRRTTAAGVSRGLTYWKDGRDERIFAPVREHIFAINAKTGKLIDNFGSGGAIEVQKNLGRDADPSMASTTPGVIFQDLLIITSRPAEGPDKSTPGHIRAYDCKTGKMRWIFHTIPHPGEFGYDTWSPDSWKYSGGTNCWGGMSVDHKRGLVFLGTGSPAFDFYGGDRKGQNLFGNCVICLKAATGERVWHYQIVHHDLFDYDIPCAPNLVTVRHNGKPRDAVAQVAKTGWVYLLDRETGKPLYPIEERPVPPSTVPGESAWPTQPFV
ncbi:MAG: PQQ-binding-like beta-propeller repeat protein, partial [Acidobacteriia bacterium]|nr:PQQ-binding-like beta-propeller repeat protein [Terriglobia bacterium]